MTITHEQYINDEIVNKQRKGAFSAQSNVTISVIVKCIVAKHDCEDNNYTIGNQAERVEPVEFVLLAGLCAATDDMHTFDQKEVDDDLKSASGTICNIPLKNSKTKCT